MKIKHISKSLDFDTKPESYFINGGSDDEVFLDECCKQFFQYNEETKIVSFINKGELTFKDLKEKLNWRDDIEDNIEKDLEERITRFKEAWMIDWIEEYFESDGGEVINPFKVDKRDAAELWN